MFPLQAFSVLFSTNFSAIIVIRRTGTPKKRSQVAGTLSAYRLYIENKREK